MIKILVPILLLALLCSCGDPKDLPKGDGNQTSNDCSGFVPEGFTLENQLEGCGFALGVAKKGDGVCPRVLIVVKDGKLVRISEEIRCKSIVFGQDDLMCAKISEGIRGVAVEFETGGSGYEDTYIKIIDDKELVDVKVGLGAGFVARDFADLNYDGIYELILIDNRWAGLRIFDKSSPPFTQKIAVFENGRFVDQTSRFASYLEAGTKQWAKLMSEAPNEIEAAKAAVVLALVYRDRGQAGEGKAVIEKVMRETQSQTLKESMEYFLEQFGSDNNPDWFYPARMPAWEPIRWQQTKTP